MKGWIQCAVRDAKKYEKKRKEKQTRRQGEWFLGIAANQHQNEKKL